MLVLPEDSESLGASVLRVLDGEGICDPDNFAGSATRRFSYKSVAHRILAVYEDICKEQAR